MTQGLVFHIVTDRYKKRSKIQNVVLSNIWSSVAQRQLISCLWQHQCNLTNLKSPVSRPNCSKNLSSWAPDRGCGGGGGLGAAEYRWLISDFDLKTGRRLSLFWTVSQAFILEAKSEYQPYHNPQIRHLHNLKSINIVDDTLANSYTNRLTDGWHCTRTACTAVSYQVVQGMFFKLWSPQMSSEKPTYGSYQRSVQSNYTYFSWDFQTNICKQFCFSMHAISHLFCFKNLTIPGKEYKLWPCYIISFVLLIVSYILLSILVWNKLWPKLCRNHTYTGVMWQLIPLHHCHCNC
jgi:hypothetical protein